ncbi:MAG: hypothetical protein QGM45_12255 [Anaerolineales bacterium]|nr:hypothetical protein [Anaerolineales bacterium]
MGKLLRITGSDRYEVHTKGGVWKSGPKRSGPIHQVRISVHGFSWGAGYRAFLRVATPRYAASSFGVFIKLLEVGADVGLDERWIIQPRSGVSSASGEDAYLGAIAAGIGFSLKDVEKAAEVLTHPEVAWLEWVEIDEASGMCVELPAESGNPRPCTDLTCTDLTCNQENTVSEKNSPPAPLAGIEFPSHMDTPAVRQAAEDWLVFHVRLGKKYQDPPKQMALLFKQHPTAEGFVADVEHSIANNYQGLIHAKGKYGKQQRDNTGSRPGTPGRGSL